VGAVTVGVDIGQRRDPTAIAVVEQERRGSETHHIVRHLERLPLGSPYPAVAERIAAVVGACTLRRRGRLPPST
jgi:hypothetical protein